LRGQHTYFRILGSSPLSKFPIEALLNSYRPLADGGLANSPGLPRVLGRNLRPQTYHVAGGQLRCKGVRNHPIFHLTATRTRYMMFIHLYINPSTVNRKCGEIWGQYTYFWLLASLSLSKIPASSSPIIDKQRAKHQGILLFGFGFFGGSGRMGRSPGHAVSARLPNSHHTSNVGANHHSPEPEPSIIPIPPDGSIDNGGTSRANDDSPLPGCRMRKSPGFFLTGKRAMCMLCIELHSK